MDGSRIHYLDWLRWAAVVFVVAYHAVLPFGSFGTWLVENGERVELLGLATSLLAFAFPVFFLLGGASARMALRRRSIRAFLSERTARLLIPFVAGTILLTPLTSYAVALHDGFARESFIAFLVAYPGLVFEKNVLSVGFSPLVFQAAMHLWFLGWLFLFAVLASPLFAFLSSGRGAWVIEALARWSRWPGSTLLFAVPITLLALPFFGVSSPTAMYDWACFAMYGGMFVVGYLIFSDERLVAAVRRDTVLQTATAVIALVGDVIVTGLMPVVFAGGSHVYDATYVLVVGLLATANCAAALALLGAAMRLGFMRRPLPHLAAATSMPTYILHFPIVVGISILVVHLQLDVPAKIALNVALGVGVAVLVAAVAVRLPLLAAVVGARHAESTPEPTVRSMRRAGV